MNARNGLGRALGATLALLVATAGPAHAYIDPGTGSMLIQLAAASLAGAIFFLRDLPRRIAAWFAASRELKEEEGTPERGE